MSSDRFSGLGGVIITLSLAVFFAAIFLPIAMDQLFGVNTTTWPTAVSTLWDNLPLIVIAVVFLILVNRSGLTGGRGGV